MQRRDVLHLLAASIAVGKASTIASAVNETGYGWAYQIEYGGPIEPPPKPSDYSDDEGLITSVGLRDAIEDWRTGRIDTDLLREIVDYWRSGNELED